MINIKKFTLLDKNRKLTTSDFIKEVTHLSKIINNFLDSDHNLILCIYNRSVHNIIIPFSIWKSKKYLFAR